MKLKKKKIIEKKVIIEILEILVVNVVKEKKKKKYCEMSDTFHQEIYLYTVYIEKKIKFESIQNILFKYF
jgi:hypothetical protein